MFVSLTIDRITTPATTAITEHIEAIEQPIGCGVVRFIRPEGNDERAVVAMYFDPEPHPLDDPRPVPAAFLATSQTAQNFLDAVALTTARFKLRATVTPVRTAKTADELRTKLPDGYAINVESHPYQLGMGLTEPSTYRTLTLYAETDPASMVTVLIDLLAAIELEPHPEDEEIDERAGAHICAVQTVQEALRVAHDPSLIALLKSRAASAEDLRRRVSRELTLLAIRANLETGTEVATDEAGEPVLVFRPPVAITD